MLTDYGTVE